MSAKEIKVYTDLEIYRETDRGTPEKKFVLESDYDQALAEKDLTIRKLVILLNSVVKHTQDVQLEKNLEIYSLHERIIETIKPIANELEMTKD